MATTTRTITTDDISGEEGASTRTIVIGDAAFQIDLTDTHFDEFVSAFRGHFADYIDAAHSFKPTVLVDKKPARTRNRAPQNTNRIRAWAWAQGYQLGNRGRIPAHIVEAYHAAPENHDA